jgi:hypothetical protein
MAVPVPAALLGRFLFTSAGARGLRIDVAMRVARAAAREAGTISARGVGPHLFAGVVPVMSHAYAKHDGG